MNNASGAAGAEKLSVPGLAFDNAASSARFFTFSEEFTTSACVKKNRLVTGAMLLSASKPGLL